jgi:antitoxin HigA-1
MTSRSSTTTSPADFPAAHPGDVLRFDFMEPLGLSRYALAKAIGVSQVRVGALVAGKRGVTADTALRLARCFGTSPEFWLRMQVAHDLAVARDQSGASIDRTVTPRAA